MADSDSPHASMSQSIKDDDDDELEETFEDDENLVPLLFFRRDLPFLPLEEG